MVALDLAGRDAVPLGDQGFVIFPLAIVPLKRFSAVIMTGSLSAPQKRRSRMRSRSVSGRFGLAGGARTARTPVWLSLVSTTGEIASSIFLAGSG